MFLKISDGRLELEDAWNFRAFDLRAPSGFAVSAIAEAVADVGTIKDEYAFLDADRVASLGPAEDGQKWTDAFEAMLSAAEKFGFYDSKTRRVRAHIKREP